MEEMNMTRRALIIEDGEAAWAVDADAQEL